MSTWTLAQIGKLAGAYAAGTYLLDVVAEPAAQAAAARQYANARRKPVINVGAGTPGSSLRAALLGPTLWGDVNIDIAAPRVPPGPNHVSYGDAHDLREYPNKYFASLIASHVLEHLDDPTRALREWDRVAERCFIIVPKWWAPHTWLHPGHRWYVQPNLAGFSPLHQPPRLLR